MIPAQDLLSLPSLARVLVSEGALPVRLAQEVFEKSKTTQKTFIEELLLSGKVIARDIVHALSCALSIPSVDLTAVDLRRLPKEGLDDKLMVLHQVLVLAKVGNRLLIATADPTNQEIQEKVKFAAQMPIDWVVVDAQKIAVLLQKKSSQTAILMDAGVQAADDFGFEQVALEETVNPAETVSIDLEDAPVVKFLQKMLSDAVNMSASDLHFEPYESNYRVRFRIDGELREISSPPLVIKEKLASRIKVLSRLDISEKRVPQDGRMKLKIGMGRLIDFRVSTLPTIFGEKIVIRILDSSSVKMGIDALGYDPEEKERLLQAIKRPHGMILLTGPTGSGKTVSLYTCLNIINQPGVNIATVEDPSEINLPGVNQVNVNEKAGLTFSVALRAFLRQDPDVIMVGEVRDVETADIAIKAAQTGHLVLTTLHTNDAPSTLTRLRNMGIAPFNIASSVTLITAQRLARRLCSHCKTLVDLPRETLLQAGFEEVDLNGSWFPYKAVGCSHCAGGYKGRVGIYQVMPISQEIQKIILQDGSVLDIEAQARKEGVLSLRDSGLRKVKLGLTSLEEVLSVTN